MSLPEASRAKRVLLYSPDAVGLGHVRRLLKIARPLEQRLPGTAMLLVTGCATTRHLEHRPPGLDFVRLPSWKKIGPERFEPLDLPVSRAEFLELRAQLVLQSAATFRPDLLLVDHDPRGRAGELLPTLRWLREQHPACRIVLGLRDIIDEPATVRAVWADRGIPGILERFYDLVLVYGSRDVVDVAAAYALPEELARKLCYSGYLGVDGGWRARQEVWRELGMEEGTLVVANAGGGADGFRLLSCFLEALPLLPTAVRSLVVTGPLMPRAEQEAIALRARAVPGCRVVGYVPDLPSVLAAAATVVSMFGYNVATELAALGVPAIVVPRSAHRQEQLIRARAFAERGLIDLLPEDDLDPRTLARLIERHLGRPAAPAPLGHALDFGGLDRVVAALAGLLVPPVPPRQN